MLVLSRHKDQSVFITDQDSGNVLQVTVVDIRGDKVRLGFEGPDGLVIMREELLISQEVQHVNTN